MRCTMDMRRAKCGRHLVLAFLAFMQKKKAWYAANDCVPPPFFRLHLFKFLRFQLSDDLSRRHDREAPRPRRPRRWGRGMEVEEGFGFAPSEEEAERAKQNVFFFVFSFCFPSCVRWEGRRRLGSPTGWEGTLGYWRMTIGRGWDTRG